MLIKPVGFIIVLGLIGCSVDPNYDPFDDEFSVSVRKLIANGCDTISAGCGYFNLSRKFDNVKMYYQIYDDDFFEVVAKGFVYHIDTFKIGNKDEFYRDEFIDSLKLLSIEKSSLNEKIMKYNYLYLDRTLNSVRIINYEKLDTINLRINIAKTDHRNKIVRNLEYFIGNPEAY